jgi:hypothetical protein
VQKMSRALVPVMAVMMIIGVAAAPAVDKQLPSVCRLCNMHLDPADRRFSVTVAEGMEASAFDDIGCALLWRDGEGAMRTSSFDANARVYDFRTGEPIMIEQAFFVHRAGLRTPMGYDIAAFKKRDDAESLVQEKGQRAVLTFNQLCSLKLK